MVRLATIFSAVLLAAALLSACGGGDEEAPEAASTELETTAAAPALSKEEIVAEGDAICAEVNAAIGGLESAGATPATQITQRTDLYTGMVERLRGLDSDDPGLTDVFSAGRDLVQAAAEAEEAAAAGDTEATVAAETTVEAALSAFQGVADAYGFAECGGEPSSPVTTVPGDGGADQSSEAPAETAPAPETTEPAPSSGGSDAAGGAPATGAEDGGTAGGTGGDTGAGDGGGAGAGEDSSTGGFSPGG